MRSSDQGTGEKIIIRWQKMAETESGSSQVQRICPAKNKFNERRQMILPQFLMLVKWRSKTKRSPSITATNLSLLLMLVLIAHELYSNQRFPCHQRCLPFIKVCSAVEILPSLPQNESSAAIPIMSIPTEDNTTTLAHEASHQPSRASNKPINKHQAPSSSSSLLSHNVLCNSRCQCVILDSTPTSSDDVEGQSPKRNDTSDAAEQQRTRTKEPRKSIEQTLIAFSEDYSLDYENVDSSPSPALVGPEQNDGNGLQQPLTLNGTDSGAATALNGKGGSSNSARNPQTSGRSTNSDLPYAAISISRGNATAAANKTTTEAVASQRNDNSNASVNDNATGNAHSNHNTNSASRRQPVVAPPTQLQQQPLLPNMFPLPLHHLHHHLHHGGAGSGGRESSGPQLYAQSLYSSQAPKLSYHAHAPYLKTASPSLPSTLAAAAATATTTTLTASASASASVGATTTISQQQQQQAPAIGDALPPGGHHQYLRPGSASSFQQRASQRASAGKQLIRRLIPLEKLQMDGKLIDRQNKTQEKWLESRKLAETLAKMLEDIEEGSVQSLSLRDNDLQFELWSEIYALLAVNLRRNIYHLDLSHNSLAKLALTFTGHLEHHQVVHGIWPFSNSSQADHSSTSDTSDFSPIKQLLPKQGNRGKGVNRHQALLTDEKLYTLVKKIMANHSTNYDQTTYANATSFLLQQPMQLRALDLSHNKLKWLINDQFRALKHVHTIRLDYNRIRYIHQHAFSGLDSLRFLNLNFNRLQVIYIEQFQTNFNLLALMLRSNHLAYLRGGAFASQVNMRRLDLSQNKLTIMSNNAFVGLESLELLNCSSNQFVHAPTAAFHPLTNLRQLDLSDNLIAQLAPGTFFHLPIEELWLERSEQLVSIDRGAFWDLPYLRQLHLSSNPMLMSISQQAFVGSQNLQRIDTNDCPSLESNSRRLLDNITMAATSRLLRYTEQQQHSMRQNITQQEGNQPAPAPPEQPSTPTASVLNKTQTENEMTQAKLASTSLSKSQLQQIAIASANGRAAPLRYFYYLAVITSLVVALKLVYKYTATSHFMEARRRRRRVYESSADGSELDSSSSSSMASYEMCARPGSESSDQHVLGSVIHHHLPPIIRDERGNSRRASEMSSIYEEQREHAEQVPCDQEGLVEDINVISSSELLAQQQVMVDATNICCPECPQSQVQAGDLMSQPHLQSTGHQTTSTIDLIHSQLVAAGFDYGHANCAHFYQSLGPALQLADITANFVNGMDYY